MTTPERIGKYTITEVLGSGAMGVVYRGFDPHIQRDVAIKVIHKALLGGADAKDSIAARFRNEAQAVGRVAHPGVVAIHEFGEDDDTAYIVMEYVPGRDLEHMLAATPLLDEPLLLSVMDQLLAALAAAHARGVWHRDIKPSNLLVMADGVVKLTDFGIARLEHAALTQAASMIGTPGYMAPEQYMGEGVDHRADLFACGAVLYRLLAGKPAFSGGAETIMYKILNEDPAAPSTVSLGRRPAAYDTMVARALSKLAADRFASAEAMRQALRAAASGGHAAGANGAGAASGADNDATVIVPSGQRARPVPVPVPVPVSAPSVPVAAAAPSTTASPSGIGSSVTGLQALSGWDPVALSRIERALAGHVGPMARLMVRQAAAGHTDINRLATALSEHIDAPDRRQQFLSHATGGSQTQITSLTSPGTLVSAPSEDFKLRAQQIMLKRIGPIAKVVVKRAVNRCGADRARLIDLLVEAVPAEDQPALQRELVALG